MKETEKKADNNLSSDQALRMALRHITKLEREIESLLRQIKDFKGSRDEIILKEELS